METIETKRRNDGFSTKRLREILGVKQEQLADKLGVSQQTVSKLEAKDIIDDETLTKIADALHISVEAIKDFSEEGVVNIVNNTFQDEAVSYAVHYKCTFNPIDKVVDLYERLLQAEREKNAALLEALKDKK